MLKKFPKILTIIFLSVFILQMVCFIFLLATPKKSQAADIRFRPQVEIPGLEKEVQKDEKGYYVGTEIKIIKGDREVKVFSSDLLGKYIKAIYNYAIGIVGILAAVVLMFGGVIWLTAGGSQEKVKEAKAWIGASISGLVLVLCSYMILNTINPDLVSFKPIETEVPGEIFYGCCEGIDKDMGNVTGYAAMMINSECVEKKGEFFKDKFSNIEKTKCTDENLGCCYTSIITMDGDNSSCSVDTKERCSMAGIQTFYEGKKCEEIEKCKKYIK